MKPIAKFVVSQVAILIRDNKCLILEYAQSPGKWGLPGGKIDEDDLRDPKDMAGGAFRREIEEEIGFTKFENVGVVDYKLVIGLVSGMPTCIIASFIINSEDEIKLSPEHLKYKWIGLNELDNQPFFHNEVKEIIKKGFAFKQLYVR